MKLAGWIVSIVSVIGLSSCNTDTYIEESEVGLRLGGSWVWPGADPDIERILNGSCLVLFSISSEGANGGRSKGVMYVGDEAFDFILSAGGTPDNAVHPEMSWLETDGLPRAWTTEHLDAFEQVGVMLYSFGDPSDDILYLHFGEGAGGFVLGVPFWRSAQSVGHPGPK